MGLGTSFQKILTAGVSLVSSLSLLACSVQYGAPSPQSANATAPFDPAAFYVSPSGSDTYDGHAPYATGTSAPFATIAQALTAAAAKRALQKTANALAPITVYVRAGTYRLTAPLNLTDSLSGNAGNEFTLTNYPGEKPVLSGGLAVSGFTLYDSTKNIWKAAYPNSGIDLVGQLHNLWVDDAYAVKARYPKYDTLFTAPEIQTASNWMFTTTTNLTTNGNTQVAQDGFTHIPIPSAAWSTIGSWDFGSAEITPFDNAQYSLRTFPIASVDTGNENLLFANPYENFQVNAGNRFAVSNVLNTLTDPGEWFLDKTNRAVYFIPLTGSAGAHTVEISAIPTLIQVSGSSSASLASYLNVSGFELTEASDTFANANPAYKDGGAITVARASHVNFGNLWLHNLSGTGVNVTAYTSTISLAHSVLDGLGAGGLVAYGHPAYGTPPDALSVSSCFFSRTGLFMNMAAVYLFGASDSTISGSQFERSTGPSVGQAGDVADGFVLVNNTVVGNDTYLTVLNSADLGSIYVAGNSSNNLRTFTNSTIVGNRVRQPVGVGSDSSGNLLTPYAASSFYIDNFASGNLISNNVAAGAAHANFKLNAGSSNSFRNNLATNTSNAFDSGAQVELYTFVSSPSDPNYFSGNTFTNNAFAMLGSSDASPFFQFPDFAGPDASLSVSEGNAFWRSTTNSLPTYANFYQTSGTTQETFQSWQSASRDLTSQTASSNLGFGLSGNFGLGITAGSALAASGIGPPTSLKTGLRYEFGDSDACLAPLIGTQMSPIYSASPAAIYACLFNKQ